MTGTGRAIEGMKLDYSSVVSVSTAGMAIAQDSDL